jgi:hypothetical protein
MHPQPVESCSYHSTSIAGISATARNWDDTAEIDSKYSCRISGFHGGDYEEWRLLGYKNPVHTS